MTKKAVYYINASTKHSPHIRARRKFKRFQLKQA